jgi:general nucleoside transport system ATP-binding protein
MKELVMRAVRKRFGAVQALRGVDFVLRGGEIHGLLGENGAGKSTLMKILFGAIRPDAGEIALDGRPVAFFSPQDAIAAGVGMVHQHFHLVETFSVRENVLLGDRTGRTPDEARRTLAARAERLGLAERLDAPVATLSVGVRQRVEILRALYREAKILLLDEPTSVLTPQEAADLFVMLDELRAQGVAVVFITHKLQEIVDVCDRATVLRRGATAATLDRTEFDRTRLAELMIGRPASPPAAREGAPRAEIRLRVRGLTTRAEPGRVALRNVNFEICAGEIFGIAGVDGNGQRELAEAVVGLSLVAGEITLDGCALPNGRRNRGRAGVGYAPQDRRAEGLALEMSAAENAALGYETSAVLRRGPLLSPAALRAHFARLAERFDIRAAGASAPVSSLSGGNQQKLLLARELAQNPKLLVAVNPTWGVDVGAIERIHEALAAMRAAGGSVLLISNELEEILGLADRFAVLYAGTLSAPLPPTAPPRQVGLLMAGVPGGSEE